MQPKILIINDISISYQEYNSHCANTIIFIHGNSNSNLLWKNQLNNRYFKTVRIIAVDLPGHGNSSHSSKPAEDYTVIELAHTIQRLIQQLGVEQSYILCGFSLGSNVVAEMLAFDHKPKGVILISPTIVGKSITPETLNDKAIVGEVLFNADVDDDKLKQYADLALAESPSNEKKRFVIDFRKTDKMFRSGLVESVVAGNYSDEIALLNDSGIPCLMIVGTDDKIVIPDSYDKKGIFTDTTTIQKIAGGHYLPLEQPETINIKIEAFLMKVL